MKLKLWFLSLQIALASLSFNVAFAADNAAPTDRIPPVKGASWDTYREITPNAGPRVVNGADVIVFADFIWWRVTQDGTNYAMTGVSPTRQPVIASSTPPHLPEGKMQSVGDVWTPGFRVGLGLNMEHDGWDLIAQYTWLRPSNRNRLNGPLLPTLFGDLIDPSTATNNNFLVRSAVANWSLQFNVIDLELGRNFYVSQHLTLRPHLGLKGTWQEQDFRVRYNNPSYAVGSGVNYSGPATIHWHNNYHGVGLRTGLDTTWYFAKNWSFYGKLAGSALWIHYDPSTVKQKVDDQSGVSVPFLNSKYDKNSAKFVAELEAGLRWEQWLYNDTKYLCLQLGFEEQIWVNNISFLSLDETWNDLNMYGLTLKARFDF
ncbi:MAG: autotransporter outer membrane beta-barrel domain-containing protein [Simkania negevensis]|nr:autotransporter outer membrane beta-barrel domain-containing protein [Simkania negevensis]